MCQNKSGMSWGTSEAVSLISKIYLLALLETSIANNYKEVNLEK